MLALPVTALVLSLLSVASYFPIAKVPALRRTMWPLWVFFGASLVLVLISVLLGGFGRFNVAALVVCAMFFLFYFTSLRVAPGTGRPLPGNKLPAFKVHAENGQIVSPSDYIGKGPLLLIFFRGFWCISCSDELRGLGEVQAALKALGGNVLAISTDKLDALVQGRKDDPNLPVILAADPDGNAIMTLHLLHEQLSKIGKVLPVPANILLDANGVVRWVHYANIVMDRPDPKDVLARVLSLGSNEPLLGAVQKAQTA